ncbi:hypothetical protein [Flavobacterium kingsejongi]|uniref:DUF669 domain-containing protein n=1 Tax=Flavobacterium kingsejongi TaxID=1678728 RepID=A0A2S1LQM9_9FLAO|nr:hypothetical protein [Flavobacterium kingsejongi]AWG26029.1 hypothetical protein FK004_12735 [Flavobacterium kingsejongi]
MKNSQTTLVNVKELPNLHLVEASPRELSSEYWTPETPGEYKVGVVLSLKEESYTDDKTGESILLPCIIMLSQNEDQTFSTIRNGSKRLYATIESAIESGELMVESTAVRITFLGKMKNKTNQFLSDKWSVKPLIY